MTEGLIGDRQKVEHTHNMAGNFEKIMGGEGHMGQTKAREFSGVQKSADRTDERSLAKELKEDSFAKASMLELLVDNIVGKLSLPENYKIIDEAVGEEGAGQELADRFWKYSEKLGNKKIIPDNNVKDVIGNLYHALFSFIDRAKRKGADKCKDDINGTFHELREYLGFLEKYGNFEKAELNSRLGFLSSRMESGELETLKTDKSKYIEECGRILKKEN